MSVSRALGAAFSRHVTAVAFGGRAFARHRPSFCSAKSSTLTRTTQRWASSTTPTSSTTNPAETEAMHYLEEGTQRLEEGDVKVAKVLYLRSVELKRTPSALFNLGVTHYHLKEFDEAIAVWKESIALQPSSPDAHTNLASAYIVSPVSRPDLALHHLRVASSLAPDDGEIAFNLAAVAEACGLLKEALTQYTKSEQLGVERAALHMRNVAAKMINENQSENQSK